MRTENSRNKYTDVSTQSGSGNFFKPLLKGIITAAVISFALLALLAVLITLKDLPNTLLPYFVTAIVAVGTLMGGISAGKASGTKGLFYGICVALVLIIIVFIIGLSTNVNNPLPQKLIQVALMAITGAIGGVIGCNKKRKR